MKKLYEEEKIQAIADAIRAKTGKTDKMKIGDMSLGVEDISLSKVFDDYISGNLTEIESDAESVVTCAFYTHTEITTVKLPKLTTLEQFAFSGTNVGAVYLDSIETIGEYAFSGMMYYSSFFSGGSITTDTVNDSPMLSYIYAPKLKTIESFAFFGCNRIRLGDDSDLSSLTSIGECAFLNCEEPWLYFPNVESVGSDAFAVVKSVN